MRLRGLVILIVVYVLAAFGWLTFSLLNYSDSEYKLKNDVLKAGLNACILQIVQGAKNGQFGKDSTEEYYLKALKLDVQPMQLQAFVATQFDENYILEFNPEAGRTIIEVKINPVRLAELDGAKREQRRLWLLQSLLLLILVGTGLFGVFYSINSLYKLNKQQNNFLLSVTHEFKTPIASIRLLMQTMQNPKIKEELKPDLIDKSIQNTYRLEELTENMLTATQMEYDKYQYNRIKFNLSELLERMVVTHRVKGEIKAQIEPDVYIYGDEFILRIAISNLLGNAFKYSDDQPIVLKLYRNKKKVVIEIRDTGVGIPKGEHKRIFDKFYRVQDEETRTTKGTGLGLFIVKRAVENHNGSVVASDNEPHGTVFTVTLPT